MGWQCRSPGAGVEQELSFVHCKLSLDSGATVTFGFQGCSAVTSDRFALGFDRANVRGRRISTLHQHIFREIKCCALKRNYSQQKRPTFIQLSNINSSTALIRLQSGRSAKYLKKHFMNQFAQMHFERVIIGLATFLNRKGG